MKKTVSALIALLLLGACIAPTLASCQKQNTEGSATTEDTAVTEQTIVEEKGIEKIYVVRPEVASDAMMRLVNNASKVITEETGIATEVIVDLITPYEAKEGCYYVIFGDTTYAQSKALSGNAEDNKMYYSASKDHVAVYAKTEQLLTIAAEQLFAQCIKDGKFGVDEKYNSLAVDGSDYVRDGWQLNFPAFKRGQLGATVYDTGRGFDKDRDASRLQAVALITADPFREYCAQLEAAGYTKEFENEIEGDLFASFSGVLGTNIYAYFTKSKFEIKIIEDNVSAPLSKFCYELDASSNTRLYAFKLDYKSEDCFLIHLADNSWFIIDGGNTGSVGGSEYVRDMYNFMVEKSNLKEGEKLQISCWYLSHAHSDHFFGMYGLVREYGTKIEIHRVIDNTPVDGFMVCDERGKYESLLSKIKKDYDAMYLKAHTGMKVQIADMSIEVLFTQEDKIAEYYTGWTTNPNNVSLISRFDIAGLTFLGTGDNKVAEHYRYSTDKYTVDVLKIAHHYYDQTMDKFYEKLYKTGKIAYCYNPRWASTATAANNYQAPTLALFGSKYLQGYDNVIYEFYKVGSFVRMSQISC